MTEPDRGRQVNRQNDRGQAQQPRNDVSRTPVHVGATTGQEAPVYPRNDANPRRPRPMCTHCQRPGHTEDKCWIKYPDSKPANLGDRRAGRSDNSSGRRNSWPNRGGGGQRNNNPPAQQGTPATSANAVPMPNQQRPPPNQFIPARPPHFR